MRCMLAAAALLLSACDAPSREEPAAGDDMIAFDTIVTAQSGALGEISDMTVASDGRVWLTDRINNHLAVVDPETRSLTPTGREGEGPGEFRGPEAVSSSDEHLLVFERRNRRVQEFTPDAEFVRSAVVETTPFLPVALNDRGDLALPTLGRDNSLAVVIQSSGAQYNIGTALAPPPQMIPIALVRAQAMRGEIPVEFINNVLPVLSSTGTAFLVIQATGAIMAFDPNGEQQWSTSLPEPDVAASLAAFFEKYRADTTAMGIHVPEMVRSGVSVDGATWLSMPYASNGTSAVVVLDDQTGELIRRFDLPFDGTVGSIAVDNERHRLFVTVPDEAILLMATYAPL